MNLRTARAGTAIVIAGICVWLLAQGVNLVRFTIDEHASAAAGAAGERLRGWLNYPGLASQAYADVLRAAGDPADSKALAQRRDQLGDLLSMRPLAPREWYSLAVVLRIAAAPADKVNDALTLSELTGANEGPVMLPRAIFGLSMWETLPAELRKRAIADLTGAPSPDLSTVRIILMTKPQDVRDDIRAAIEAEGVPAQVLERLGL